MSHHQTKAAARQTVFTSAVAFIQRLNDSSQFYCEVDSRVIKQLLSPESTIESSQALEPLITNNSPPEFPRNNSTMGLFGMTVAYLAFSVVHFVQFALAITVCGLYGVDLSRAAKAGKYQDSKWVSLPVRTL